jgi:hypothetical protein
MINRRTTRHVGFIEFHREARVDDNNVVSFHPLADRSAGNVILSGGQADDNWSSTQSRKLLACAITQFLLAHPHRPIRQLQCLDGAIGDEPGQRAEGDAHAPGGFGQRNNPLDLRSHDRYLPQKTTALRAPWVGHGAPRVTEWRERDLNSRHRAYESPALPAELPRRLSLHQDLSHTVQIIASCQRCIADRNALYLKCPRTCKRSRAMIVHFPRKTQPASVEGRPMPLQPHGLLHQTPRASARRPQPETLRHRGACRPFVA